jgi:hypothetical protein
MHSSRQRGSHGKVDGIKKVMGRKEEVRIKKGGKSRDLKHFQNPASSPLPTKFRERKFENLTICAETI